MKPSMLFGQTSRTSIGIPIPSEMIMPTLLPGVEVPTGGYQVRVDVHIFLEALASGSELEVDFQMIVFRNSEVVCSRSIRLSKMNRAEEDWYPLSQFFSFIDVPLPGEYTYKLGILPAPGKVLRVKSLLLLDCSLLAHVSELLTRPLPKDTVLVGNSEMGSMFLCSTSKLERIIPTGQAVTNGVWLPDGSAFYGVSDRFSGVFRLDAATSHVTPVLPEGQYGSCIISPNGHFFYVANDKGIVQIDTKTQRSKNFKIPEREEPPCFILHPDGKRLYVGLGDDGIAIVNTASMQQVGKYPVKGVREMLLSANRTLLAAVGTELSFIFPETGMIRKVGSIVSYEAAILSSRLNVVCVTEKQKQVSLVDLKTGVRTTIPLPLEPMSFICLDDKRDRLFVPMVGSDHVATLAIVDLNKRAVVLTEEIHPGFLASLKLDKDGRLWAATLDRILLLDSDTLEVYKQIETGINPCSIFFRP